MDYLCMLLQSDSKITPMDLLIDHSIFYTYRAGTIRRQGRFLSDHNCIQ